MRDIQGRPRRIVVTTLNDNNGNIKLTVEDTGIGIDPASRRRLFDAFYTTKERGMGIGLSVSRSIIEHHQGSIWAEANEGFGARFSFTLPINPEHLAAPSGAE
jgi:signal transduction histidine kinase